MSRDPLEKGDRGGGSIRGKKGWKKGDKIWEQICREKEKENDQQNVERKKKITHAYCGIIM